MDVYQANFTATPLEIKNAATYLEATSQLNFVVKLTKVVVAPALAPTLCRTQALMFHLAVKEVFDISLAIDYMLSRLLTLCVLPQQAKVTIKTDPNRPGTHLNCELVRLHGATMAGCGERSV